MSVYSRKKRRLKNPSIIVITKLKDHHIEHCKIISHNELFWGVSHLHMNKNECETFSLFLIGADF